MIALPIPAVNDLINDKQLIIVETLKDIYEELWFVAAQRKLINHCCSSHGQLQI